MPNFTQLINQLLTGKDNSTQDIARWSWLVSGISVLGGAVWNAYNGEVVDLVKLASAFGIVAGAHSAAIYAKKDSEPT